MKNTMIIAGAIALALPADVAHAEATDYVPMYEQYHVMTIDAATGSELGMASGHMAVDETGTRSTVAEFAPSESNG